MATEHTATVTLGNGTELDVFDRYTVTLDMMRAGNPWTVSLWRSTVRQTTWPVLRREVKLFQPVTVSIDGAAQMTGRIETIDTHAAKDGGAAMVLSGRDLGGVAMSWDADPTVRLKGLPLSTALTSLFLSLGVPVFVTDAAAARIVQSGTNHASLGRSGGGRHPTRGVNRARARHRAQPIDRSHPRAGEKVWQLAEEMCRRLGFLLWIAPSDEGGIAAVVDVPDFDAPDVFAFARSEDPSRPSNILTGSEKFTAKEVPTEVNVYTGTVRGDLISNRVRHRKVNAGLLDRAITRGFVPAPVAPLTTPPPQVRHIKSSRSRTGAASEKEAERVIAEAMAEFRRYELTVQGHGQTVDGFDRLYALNTMARVRDELCTDPDGNPLDESMLIIGVTFEGSRQGGTTTKLTLAPKGSIVVIPQDP